MWFLWLLTPKGGERRGREGRGAEGEVEQALDGLATLGSQPPTVGWAVSLARCFELSPVTDVDSAVPTLQALHSTHPRVAFRVSFN